jgi:hypothetical protein
MNYKLKSGLSGLTTAQLVDKAGTVIRNVDGNANFPTPDPAIADLRAAVDVTEEYMEKAELGFKPDIDRRNVESANLLKLMRRLASYVDFTANGNKGIIISSGFEVRRKPEPTGPLGRPVSFAAERSEISGEVILDWKAVPHAKAYQVEYTTSDPASPDAEWIADTVTSKSKTTVSNLTKGTDYYFRVRAISGNKKGAYSNVALIMAA